MSGAGGSVNRSEGVKEVVGRVLDKRIVNGEVQYLVQWQTWEPERNLVKCPEKIAEFERALKQIESKNVNLAIPKTVQVQVQKVRKEGGGHASTSFSGGKNSTGGCGGTRYPVDTTQESAGSKKGRTAKELVAGCPSSSTVRREGHPLLNPLILTNLFRMVPPKALANCRRVCKAWKENSLSAWRSSSTLQLLYSNKKVTLTPSRYNGNHSHNAPTLNEFLEYWARQCSVKPYRRFHLNGWILFEPSARKATKTAASLEDQINRFWSLTGMNLTALTLTDCQFSEPAELRKILFQSCPNLETVVMDNCTIRGRHIGNTSDLTMTAQYTPPVCGEKLKLKSLTVCIVPGRYKNFYGELKWDYPITHLELLSHYPALTSLRISYRFVQVFTSESVAGIRWSPDTCMWMDANMWMDAIKAIRRHDPLKLPLNQFQFDQFCWFTRDSIVEDYFKFLKEIDVSLKSVCIDLGSLTAGDKKIKDLISFHGKSLQKITANEKMSSTVNILNFGFPYGVKMENLKSLNMCDRFCRSMEFIKYTPNLEELMIYERGNSPSTPYRVAGDGRETHIVSNTFTCGDEMGNFQLVKMKKLELGCKVSVVDLMCLGKWMPNINELMMPADDDHVGVICDQWLQLVHLHVIDMGLTDEGIIGTAKGMRLRAPIKVLKGLKCLKFGEKPFGVGLKLTDLSAVNGFLVLPQLQILHFNSTSPTRFENATKEALCAKIPDCKLHSSKVPRIPGCPCCQGVKGKRAPPETTCGW